MLVKIKDSNESAKRKSAKYASLPRYNEENARQPIRGDDPSCSFKQKIKTFGLRPTPGDFWATQSLTG